MNWISINAPKRICSSSGTLPAETWTGKGSWMTPFERQGRILLAGAILVLFVSVFISMLAADPFTLGFIFAAGMGVVGLFFFVRGR